MTFVFSGALVVGSCSLQAALTAHPNLNPVLTSALLALHLHLHLHLHLQLQAC